MTQKNVKLIVAMLVNDVKITLFTQTGEVLDMKINGPYDTIKLSEDLGPQLDGSNAVEVDLNEYLTMAKALNSDFDKESGVLITTIIDGKEVQGIFYPQKIQVAVTNPETKTQTVIPKVEKLYKHMKRAADENSPAVRNFLRRLVPVVEQRLHSAEDLMDFIERSELPLTNDGKIIGYKRVNKSGDGYVDVHSGKILQHVGSRVWMDIDKVDPNRSISCSYGLHVANLGYLRGFSGSHTLIVLVDPADFIAVPHGETNKCRVCSYDVIGVMTSGSQKVVNNGQHVEDDLSLQSLIKAAVNGTHIKPYETVKVGQKEVLERLRIVETLEETQALEPVSEETKESSGKSLNTDVEEKKEDVMKKAKEIATSGNKPWDSAPPEVIEVFDAMRLAGPDISKTFIAAKHNTSTRTMGRWAEKYDFEGYAKFKEDNSNMTVTEKAAHFFKLWQEGSAQALTDLVAFKKARKKGWPALGFTEAQAKKILKAIDPKNT